MLTNKEIRTIPVPKLTKEHTAILLQDNPKKPNIITVNKIKSYIIVNVFCKNENNEPELIYRYIIQNEKEARLYNLQKNKITKGYLSNTDNFSSVTSTQKEKEKLIKWLNQKNMLKSYMSKEHIKNILDSYDIHRQSVISFENQKSKHEKIEMKMKKVKKVPKSFDKTIEKAMEFSKYIFFNRKTKTGICSHCSNELNLKELPVFIENDKGICPVCKSKIVYRSENKRKNHTKANIDEGSAVLIQKYAHHCLIARYFLITYDYNKSTSPSVSTTEVHRTIIDFDNHKVEDYEWYYYNGLSKVERTWVPPQKSMFCPSGFHYYIPDGPMHETELNTEIKNAGLLNYLPSYKTICENIHQKRNYIYQHTVYFELVAKYPMYERMIKMNLHKLFYDIILDSSLSSYKIDKLLNEKAASIIDNLRLKNKKQLHEIIALNPNVRQLETIQLYNNSTNIERNVTKILELANKYNLNDTLLPILFNKTDYQINKIQEYLPQFVDEEHSINDITHDYFDYLDMCHKLNYDTKSTFILYPKDFIKAHDNTVVATKNKSNEQYFEAVNKLLPAMHEKYDFKTDKFIIKAPDKCEEITLEGHKLHHCVNNYIPSVASEKCIILFIRNVNKPNTPFVTMEINCSTNKIVQVRGFSNNKPSEEVLEFVNEFKKNKNVA